VWCSEYFDNTTQSRYSSASLVPPSSNPASIYRQLKQDVDGRDRHSSKIEEQKLSLKRRASKWRQSNDITQQDMEDIYYMVDNADFQEWRPLIYVIPRQLVQARLKPVPLSKCAGFGPEYTIEDLSRHEFDLIEL
jgi:hypothetical protein